MFNPYIFQSDQHKSPKNEVHQHQQMLNQSCTVDSALNIITTK